MYKRFPRSSPCLGSFGRRTTASKKQCSCRRRKMIYRKWSLLTGPAAILGSIVATVAVANVIFVSNDPFLEPYERKREASPSMK